MKRSSIRGQLLRVLALTAATALTAALIPAAALEEIGDGVTPTFDEAYYATLDYYGNLKEGSVVKSYTLNGARSITDYGTYDSVNNLTDGTLPSVSGGVTTFDFGGSAPDHFYFEGRTAQPFADLPWTITMSYLLNGVPTKAEDLAGKTGVVQINMDIVPNDSASDYAKNNYTLEAMAMFNQDDILSLKAEGAQVQLIGNLRVVLFLCLPGEEQHFTIEVGADDFKFDGMTYLMVPATLSQLDQIADLSQRKDQLEDDYDKLSNSLDTLLDAFSGMQGSLYATAKGLDTLNAARGTISAGKGQVYQDADVLRGDLDSISAVLEPVSGQIDSASQALTDSKAVLQVLTERVTSLRKELGDLTDAITHLQNDGEDLRDRLDEVEGLRKDLEDLERALNSVKNETVSQVDPLFGGMSSAEARAAVDQAQALYACYQRGNGGGTLNFRAFLTAALLAGGKDASQAPALYGVYVQYDSQEAAYAAAYEAALAAGGDEETAAAAATQAATAWATADAMHRAFLAAGGADSSTTTDDDGETVVTGGKNLDFHQFLYAALLLTPDHQATAAKDADSLYLLHTLHAKDPEVLDLLLGQLDSLNNQVEKLNGSIRNVNRLLKDLAEPTASLVDRLAELCGDGDELKDLLDHLDEFGDIGVSASGKGREILDSVDALYQVLDTYEPAAQETLESVKGLTVTASQTVKDSGAFFDSFESLLKTSGAQLDAGTKQTLDGMAAALRQAAKSLSTTADVKAAKSDIDDIIRDTWNEHTGDVDRLLNMDSTAQAQSLTSSRNGTPQSVQVLIRSQEIKTEEPEKEATQEDQAAESTFLGRIAQMFRDFWAAITGLFRH